MVPNTSASDGCRRSRRHPSVPTTASPGLARVSIDHLRRCAIMFYLRIICNSRRGRASSAARERVGAGKSLGGEPPGVSAVAAPVGKLLQRQGEGTLGGVDPGKTGIRLERLHVGEAA